MQQPFLAMIVPVTGGGESGGHPSHPIYWPGSPSHPIYNPPYPDQGLPGGGGSGSGGSPSHPIYNPPYPDQGLPGGGSGSGGSPSHPIWRPDLRPDQGLPGAQPKTYAGVPESSIPAHPDKPNPEDGEWVLVALGDRAVEWAWMTSTPPAQPK